VQQQTAQATAIAVGRRHIEINDREKLRSQVRY